MRKLAALIFSCLLLLYIVPSETLAARDTIDNGNFESNSILWSQGGIAQVSPHSGEFCLSFSNFILQEKTKFLHSISYVPRLSLLPDTVYIFEAYIRLDSVENTQVLPKCQVSMPAEEKSISVHVSHATDAWQRISVYFMVDSTDAFDFSLIFETDSAETTIFIDDVSIAPVPFAPIQMDIQGPRTVAIPENGENTYTFTPAVTDSAGNSVSVRTATIAADGDMPDGVIFSAEEGELLVTAEAESGAMITLLCTPFAGSTNLPSFPVQILLSKNILTNGTFDDMPLYSGWDTEASPFSICHETENRFAQVPTENVGAAYHGFLVPAKSFVLYAHETYVFRAKLRSDKIYENRRPQTEVLLPDENGIIHISVWDISGTSWTETMSAFRVPADGIYSIEISFQTPDERPVYVDTIAIQPEVLKPSLVYFESPGHIAIPEDGWVNIPLPFAVYDQTNTLCDHAVLFSVTPADCGVTINENMLSVSASANEGDYTIAAKLAGNAEVENTRTLTVTKESVGDGSFEATVPGQLWATASPSALHFVSTYHGAYPTDGGLFARLTMNGPVSALMSDSVFQYDNTCSYVLEADMLTTVSDIETIVTVLVDNANSDSFDDNLVVGQFTLSPSMQHIQKLFTPSEAIAGRLMIAFNTPETHDQQIILMDNIKVSRAEVKASGVNISGLPYLNMNIIGKYRFSANFDAVNASSFRWLFSSTADGIFMPIAGQTENTLSITTDMLGKYVKFEVTPVSLRGPVVGASVTSSAILVGEPIPSDTSPSDEPPAADTPPPVDNSQKEEPEENVPTDVPASIPEGMQFLNLNNFTVLPRHQFVDLNGHWAKNEIEILTAAGVVQGRGNALFEPEAHITRAEFSAFLARAFKLAPIYYEGQFQDVKYYDWYAGAIAVVTKYGIAQGTSESTFSPQLPITREEMAAMIMRAVRKANLQAATSYINYADAADISEWAKQDVGESNSLGLLSGWPDGRFLPKQKATRAEAAITIQRMLMVLTQNFS